LNRRLRSRPILFVISLAGLMLACDYGAAKRPTSSRVVSGVLPKSNIQKGAGGSTITSASASRSNSPDTPEMKEKREAILKNVLRLIEAARITPGDESFAIATQNLNQYFEQGTTPADYQHTPASRAFLSTVMSDTIIDNMEKSSFDDRMDARHIEDCMLYHAVAARIAGEGDDLTRARRLFDWMVRQVQLVPPQALAPPGMEQAQVRPCDVLVRGMATEANQGFWSERGWLFIALCRQVGIDVGLVTYTPRVPPKMLALRPDQATQGQPVGWVCAAIIDNEAYLFDHRLGIAIPNAAGTGVATLEEAMTNPVILDRLDLPGQSSYSTTRSDLINSTTKVGILYDSSPGYSSPKMRLLQTRLAGKDRTVLFRDPAELNDHFRIALGDRLSDVKPWELPYIVFMNLFTNGKFVEATQYTLRLFDRQLPLLYARIAHLNGDYAEAARQYIALRYAEGALMRDKKTVIVPALQRELDVYASYFLGLCLLEQKNLSQAELFFGQTLTKTPAPSQEREYCFMLRWGANTNLGLINVEKGDIALATRYLTQPDVPPAPTWQIHGNLWRAREALWNNPMAPIAPDLPPAPPRIRLAPEPEPAAMR
jgi:hypothetical protein